MKTKNQTEQTLLELAANKAANEEGFTAPVAREPAPARAQPWSPMEVWRTRVKTELARKEPAPQSTR
jgi:hypothetical protein